MITLETNRQNLLIRIFLIISLAYFSTNIFGGLRSVTGQKADLGAGVWLFVIICYFFAIIALLALVVYILLTFFGIIQVNVDTATDTITLKKFFSETKKSLGEISGYTRTIYTGKYGNSYRGLILKSGAGESYKLTQANLKSISSLEEYLEEKKVNFLGEKRTRYKIF